MRRRKEKKNGPEESRLVDEGDGKEDARPGAGEEEETENVDVDSVGEDLGAEGASVLRLRRRSTVRLDEISRVKAKLARTVLSPEEGTDDGGESDGNEDDELWQRREKVRKRRKKSRKEVRKRGDDGDEEKRTRHRVAPVPIVRRLDAESDVLRRLGENVGSDVGGDEGVNEEPDRGEGGDESTPPHGGAVGNDDLDEDLKTGVTEFVDNGAGGVGVDVLAGGDDDVTEAVEEDAEGVGLSATENVGELGENGLRDGEDDGLRGRDGTKERVLGEGGGGVGGVLPCGRSIERAARKGRQDRKRVRKEEKGKGKEPEEKGKQDALDVGSEGDTDEESDAGVLAPACKEGKQRSATFEVIKRRKEERTYQTR